jgi:hypothetical protein
MAIKQIIQLPAASVLNSDDVFPVQQYGTTRHISASQLGITSLDTIEAISSDASANAVYVAEAYTDAAISGIDLTNYIEKNTPGTFAGYLTMAETTANTVVVQQQSPGVGEIVSLGDNSTVASLKIAVAKRDYDGYVTAIDIHDSETEIKNNLKLTEMVGTSGTILTHDVNGIIVDSGIAIGSIGGSAVTSVNGMSGDVTIPEPDFFAADAVAMSGSLMSATSAMSANGLEQSISYTDSVSGSLAAQINALPVADFFAADAAAMSGSIVAQIPSDYLPLSGGTMAEDAVIDYNGDLTIAPAASGEKLTLGASTQIEFDVNGDKATWNSIGLYPLASNSRALGLAGNKWNETHSNNVNAYSQSPYSQALAVYGHADQSQPVALFFKGLYDNVASIGASGEYTCLALAGATPKVLTHDANGKIVRSNISISDITGSSSVIAMPVTGATITEDFVVTTSNGQFSISPSTGTTVVPNNLRGGNTGWKSSLIDFIAVNLIPSSEAEIQTSTGQSSASRMLWVDSGKHLNYEQKQIPYVDEVAQIVDGTFPNTEYTTQTLKISADPATDLAAMISLQDGLHISSLTGYLISPRSIIYDDTAAGLRINSVATTEIVAGNDSIGNISGGAALILGTQDVSGNSFIDIRGRGTNSPYGSIVSVSTDSVRMDGAGIDATRYIRLASIADVDVELAKTSSGDRTSVVWYDDLDDCAKLDDERIVTESYLSSEMNSVSGALVAYTDTSTDIQVFTSDGTWTAPSGSGWREIEVMCIGGGGGGASGRTVAVTAIVAGGNGGLAGGLTINKFAFSAITSPVAVTVGAGGSGGVADGTSSNIAGGNGSATTFGTYCSARNGIAITTAGVEGSQYGNSTLGIGGNGAVGTPAGPTPNPGSGGGGGGVSAGAPGSAFAGAAGAKSLFVKAMATWSVSTDTEPDDYGSGVYLPGHGGPGGASSTTTIASSGHGGSPTYGYGGGGGGGGGCRSGNAGNGGNGRQGVCVVTCRK